MLKRDIDNDEDQSSSPYNRHKEGHGTEASRLRVIITDMNILKWNASELSIEDVNQNIPSNRKNFLINFSLNYSSINYVDQPNQYAFDNSTKILIEQLQAHLSPEDLILLSDTYNKQMQEYWEESATLLKNLDKIYNSYNWIDYYYKIDPKPNCNPKDEEELYKFKQKITVQEAQILLLAQLGEQKGLSPFLKIIVKINPFRIISDVKSKKAMTCYLDLFILFCNPFSNKNEPMLETTPFFLELFKTSEGITYLNFQLYDKMKKKSGDTVKSPMFNINISEEMIALFIKVKESWSDKFTPSRKSIAPSLKKNSVSNFDSTQMKTTQTRELLFHSHQKKIESRKFANSYTIKNESGYNLGIRKHERNQKKSSMSNNQNINNQNINNQNINKKTTTDEKNEKKNFLEVRNGYSQDYEIDEERNFENNFEKSIKIYLEFKTYSNEIYYIQDVWLNRLRKEQKNWKSYKLATRDNIQSKFFICNVKMKETKTKLSIMSPVMMWNLTANIVDVKLISEDFEEILYFQIKPRNRIPIPLEYAENQSMFSLNFKGLGVLEENERMFTFWSLKSTQGTKGFDAVLKNYYIFFFFFFFNLWGQPISFYYIFKKNYLLFSETRRRIFLSDSQSKRSIH